MNLEKIYIIFIALFLINTYFFFQNSKISKLINLFDHPDKIRKIHKFAVPLTGGIYIFLNILIIFIIKNYLPISNNNILDAKIFVFLALFFIFGLYDDKYGINSNLKLFLSVIFFLIFILVNENLILNEIIITSGHKINLGSLAIPFTVFCLVIFQNALNMFDGINLQNISYFIFLLLIINFFYYRIDIFIYLLPILILVSYMNASNKLFLGDSGSYILSFIISVQLIDIFNSSKAIFSDEVFLFLCIPGYDLLRLAIVRILNKRHPFKGDRKHIHHLILNKMSYFKTIIYLNLICFIPIIFSYVTNQNLIAILISLTLYIFTIYYFKNEKNYQE